MCNCPHRSNAHCAACHRDFHSVSSFDRHQTLNALGLVCHEPATRGLVVVRTVDGSPVWGAVGPWSARPPRAAAPAKI